MKFSANVTGWLHGVNILSSLVCFLSDSSNGFSSNTDFLSSIVYFQSKFFLSVCVRI
jgi:hypothetical protein